MQKQISRVGQVKTCPLCFVWGYSQKVRHGILIPTFVGSIPTIPASNFGGCVYGYACMS